MGRQIIKVAPDEDLYLEWSSIVEAPTFVGTREEVAAYLLEARQGEVWPTVEQVEERLRRADETGSSGYRPLGCTWDDRGEIYQQRGFLPRDRMAAYARRLLGDIDAEPDSLLEPLEGHSPGRTGIAFRPRQPDATTATGSALPPPGRHTHPRYSNISSIWGGGLVSLSASSSPSSLRLVPLAALSERAAPRRRAT